MKAMESVDELDLLDFYLFYPRLTVLVGSNCGDRYNLMPASWHTPVSGDPPLYSVIISEKRFSFGCITKNGGFTLNFVGLEKAGLSEAAGFSSGLELDKIEEFGVKTIEQDMGFGPVLSDALCALECSLERVVEMGDYHIVIGRVQRAHWNPKTTRIYQGVRVLSPEVRPMLYAGRGIYCTWDPASFQEHRN